MQTVNVGLKPITFRYAKAYGKIKLSPETVKIILNKEVPKGDVISACKVAGIMASKKTSEILPFCHPIGFDHVEVDVNLLQDGIEVTSYVSGTGKTGYEMEALIVVSSALLCVYDMCKGLDESMVIESIKVIEKGGGKSQWSKNLANVKVYIISKNLKDLIRSYLSHLGAQESASENAASIIVSTEQYYIEKPLKGLETVINSEIFKFSPATLKEGISIGYTKDKLTIVLQPKEEVIKIFFESFGNLLGNYLCCD